MAESSWHRPLAAPRRSTASLTPLATPLARPQALHLLRRTHFGAAPAAVDALVGLSATEAVERLLTDAQAAPPLPMPTWIDERPPGRDASAEERQAFNQQNGAWVRELRATWWLALQTGTLREALTLFWHNHFVTEVRSYRYAALAYRYLSLLQTHALGSFKTFVHAVGLDPAMLVYLNGRQNRRQAPNENYARELLELFTMGPEDTDGTANYTEADIQELARALTGWVIDPETLEATLVPPRFDDGEKTIFGRTGPFDYGGVIDLLFEERARPIAQFMSRKLVQHFVHAVPDEALVAALAEVLLAEDFELAPVLRTLLASEAFFAAPVVGAQIKSPVALLVGLQRTTGDPATLERAGILSQRFARPMGQELLNPPNVKGWPGYRDWLSTSLLPLRWQFVDRLLTARGFAFEPMPLAQQVYDPAWDTADPPLGAFLLPTALAEACFAVPVDVLALAEPAEPFAGNLDAFPIPASVMDGPAHVRILAKLFLGPVPWYEWSMDQDGAPRLIASFLARLSQLPEFQLT